MYHKTVLKNGVRIISERLDYLRSISFGIWVNTGSRDEKKLESGLSHFIEHMLFKGTGKRSSHDIARQLDAIGGQFNAFTGKEQTCYHARALDKHFTALSDILSDIFLNSTFDPDDIERERQVILQEISMVEDTPDDNIHILFNHLFWKNHPIGMSVLGTDETVSAFKRDDLIEYINSHYIPENILIAAAGNVDHQSMVSFFKPLFEPVSGGENPGHNRVMPNQNADISIHFKDLEQVHLCLGGEAPSQMNDDRFACALLNTILGGNMSSRLFQEIREKRGLAYSVYSFLSSYIDTGLLGIYAATDQANVNPVLETIQTEIRKLKRGELSESDLTAAKDNLTGEIYLASESADNRMMRITKNEFNFQRYITYEETVSKLEKVSIDQVTGLANNIFYDGGGSFVALGPVKEDALEKDFLRF